MRGVTERAAAALEASGRRPLIAAMEDGRIDAAVFARYLAIESAFVADAARFTAYCLWQERDRGTARALLDLLEDLLGAQADYFERGGVAMPAGGRLSPALDGAEALVRQVESARAEGGVLGVAVSMAAAEALYARWCARAAALDTARPPAVQEWIELHADEGFARRAAFWPSLADREAGPEIDDATLDRWFAAMLEAEDAFHDAPIEATR